MKLRFNDLRVATKLFSGFIIMLIAIFTAVIISYKNSDKIIDSTDKIIHTHKVLLDLGQVDADLIDLETTQRGFIITGDHKYLEPYTKGIKVIYQNISNLQKLISDNKQQITRIDLLKEIVDLKLAELNRTIHLRKQENGFEEAKEIILTDKGKIIMDSIRFQIKEIESEELRLLSIRSLAPEKSRKNSGNILALLLIFSTLFSVMIAFFISRSLIRPIKTLRDGIIKVGGR